MFKTQNHSEMHAIITADYKRYVLLLKSLHAKYSPSLSKLFATVSRKSMITYFSNNIFIKFIISEDYKIIFPSTFKGQNFLGLLKNPDNFIKAYNDKEKETSYVELKTNNASFEHCFLLWRDGENGKIIVAVKQAQDYATKKETKQFFAFMHPFYSNELTFDSANSQITFKNNVDNKLVTYKLGDFVSAEFNPFHLNNDDLAYFSIYLNKLITHGKAIPIIIQTDYLYATKKYYIINAVPDTTNSKVFICRFYCIDFMIKDNDLSSVNPGDIDPFSQIMKRQAIVNYISQHIETIKTPAVIMVLDLDHFKENIQKYGKEAGDKIIKGAAAAIQQYIGSFGIIGRIVEDKFLIFIPGKTNDIFISNVFDGLKRILLNVLLPGISNFSLTAAIGAVVYTNNGQTFEKLFNNLDIALSKAKALGGNCGIIYDSKIHGTSNAEPYIIDKLSNNKAIKTNIISEIIDTLLNAANFDNALDAVLKDVLAYYSLDRIMLRANVRSKTLSYMCTSKKEYEQGSQNFKLLSLEPHFDSFDNSGVYVSEDNMENSNDIKSINSLLSEFKSKSSVVVKMGNFSESVSVSIFDSINEKREWDENIVKDLTIIGKTIGSFIIRNYEQTICSADSSIDNLTLIWNLAGIEPKAKEAIDKYPGKYTILTFDVMSFNHINSFYGYDFGDKVLIFISSVLSTIHAANEYYARISGDVFAFMIKESGEKRIISRIGELVSQIRYYNYKDFHVHLHYSIGSYTFKEGDVFLAGIDNANKARRQAKRMRTTNISFYNAEAEEKSKKIEEIELNGEQAIKDEEFVINYQPCYNVTGTEIVSAEALVRWVHNGQMMFPSDFIPIFEKSALIIELDFFVYEKVLSSMKMLSDRGRQIIPISVNVSRAHFMTDNFIDRLNNLCDKYQISRKMLCLEITESMLTNEGKGEEFISKLKENGYNIYLDDFGSAYSNLKLLATTSFDVIKIDKSLVDDLASSAKKQTVLKSVIAMLKALGMKILVEGVESNEQAQFIIGSACDYIQGYIYSKPLPRNTFEELLIDNQIANGLYS